MFCRSETLSPRETRGDGDGRIPFPPVSSNPPHRKWLGLETAGPPAAKRARLAPAASMKVEVLRAELRQRRLDSTGNKPGLVARVEEDRQKDGGCRWRGRVGQLPAHLGGECAWETVKCSNEGCTASPLRKELPAHDATCENCAVKCGHCSTEVMRRSLAEHEGQRLSSAQTRAAGCDREGFP